MSISSLASSKCWIYHERQEKTLLCGQHALNNLIQSSNFNPAQLSEIALELDDMQRTIMATNNEGGVNSKDYIKFMAEGSGNVDPSGNFSIEVLKRALMSVFNLTLVNVRQEDVRNKEVTTMQGFICNRESHWFAIRQINGRYWNLNSMREKPEMISHFRLAIEIETLIQSGYSVFCVVDGNLPPPCTSDDDKHERGLPQFWWNETSLLHDKDNDSESWNNVGTGMRCDGKSSTNSEREIKAIDDLTESEMLQMAMAASMQPEDVTFNEADNLDSSNRLKPLPEPEEGEAGSVKIQFRLPDRTRKIRRFQGSEVVAVLYDFVKQCYPLAKSNNLEILVGYPPKNLKDISHNTIEAAKLAGQSLQCRLM